MQYKIVRKQQHKKKIKRKKETYTTPSNKQK
jgi:hypothetical protein